MRLCYSKCSECGTIAGGAGGTGSASLQGWLHKKMAIDNYLTIISSIGAIAFIIYYFYTIAVR